MSLISCSKTNEPVTNKAYVSFDVNGSPQDWSENSEFYVSIIPTTTGEYKLYGQFREIGKGIELTFQAPSFKINTAYTYTISAPPDPLSIPHIISLSNLNFYDAANLYTSESIGDYATITITALNDNKAQGKFSALLTRRSDGAKVNITNGKFAGVDFPH